MNGVKRNKHIGLRIIAACALVAAAICVDSRFRIVTSEYVLKSRALPAAFDGLRIVQISDLHAQRFGRGNSRLLDEVAAARPDIIALTGDIVDSAGQFRALEPFIEALCGLAPVYFISGNHEWAAGDLPAFREMLTDCGVTCLSNSYVELVRGGESIIIAGVEDPNGWADMIKPDEFIAGIRAERPDDYILLLGHRNYWLNVYPDLDVDAVLCGHGHGGIVRLPFAGGVIGTDLRLFPRYTDGVYNEGNYDMVVSRGLGSSAMIPRFLNNSHLPVIILSCEN